jgi:hypothetical protein
MRDVAADVVVNDTDIDRILVIVMDDAWSGRNKSLMGNFWDPWILGAGKQIAREAIKDLGSKDLAAVVYTYMDALRPTVSAFPETVASAAPGYHAPLPADPPAAFAEFTDAHNCTGYDTWPYGLPGRNGYAAKVSDENLKKQLAARPTTYLLGELDILPLYGFDSSCSAMAQGSTRLARGLAYAKYVNERYGAQHHSVVVPACGHSALRASDCRCRCSSGKWAPLLGSSPREPTVA